jgi:hypothetical protein
MPGSGSWSLLGGGQDGQEAFQDVDGHAGGR